MRQQSRSLKPGNHIVIIAQYLGGTGRSAAAVEVHYAAKKNGVRSIVATLEPGRNIISNTLDGDGSVVYIDAFSIEEIANELQTALSELESQGGILIIDPHTNYDLTIAAVEFLNLRDDRDTVSVMIPTSSAEHEVEAAKEALAMLPYKTIRGLIRARPDIDGVRWKRDSLPESTGIEGFPVWVTQTWLQTTEDILFKRGDFSSFPNLDDLENYADHQANNLSIYQSAAMRATLDYFNDAQETIFEHLILPLLKNEAAQVRAYSETPPFQTAPSLS